MLTGAHVIVFSGNANADAAFLRDVLALPHVDAGEGFLIFGLPPAELAMHEADAGGGGKHELYLITDDVHAFVDEMRSRSIACDDIAERGWGSLSGITLPSGIKLGVYEAHHARPAAKKKAGKALRDAARAVRKATKKAKRETKKAKRQTKKAERGNKQPRT